MLTAIKPKTCRACRQKFVPRSSFATVCSVDCALAQNAAKKAKAAKLAQAQERKADKLQREKLKTRAQWEAECRAIVQKIARIRDRDDGCISCHMGANYGGQWHGSHFRPAGNNSAVQFNLWNIHKACAQCNLFKGGNLGPYRVRLVQKIGIERVEWLETQTQVVKTGVPYLARFKRVMGMRLRRMEKKAGA